MKPNFFLLLITALLSTLISYTVYSYSLESTKNISLTFSFITFFSYLGALLGVKFEYEKSQVLKNTVSVVFVLINLALTFIFLTLDYSIPIYLLVNGSILLIFYSILYFFNKSKF